MAVHHIGVLGPTSPFTWKILCNEKDNPRPFVSFHWVSNHVNATQLVRFVLCPKCETLWRAWRRVDAS